MHNAFVRTNRRAIAMMFICLSGTGVHCDHTMHFSVDLSLRLDGVMFWAPWHQSMSTYSQPSFLSTTWKRCGVWMCKVQTMGVISQERLKIEVKLLLSASRKSYMLRRLVQRWMTLSDLEWPFLHRALSLLLVVIVFRYYSRRFQTVSLHSRGGWRLPVSR